MSAARTLAIALLCTAPGFAQSPDVPATHTAFPTTTASPLSAQITTLLADPRAARAHWGIAVTDIDGTPIYGLDEGKLFRPASNAKLFTTAAAMAVLGPDATVATTVEGDMDSNGVVHGDLRLVGRGDANFGANDVPYVAPKLRPKGTLPPAPLGDLDKLVRKLTEAGLKQVVGNIVGDDSLLPNQVAVGSWEVGDLVWGYGAPVSALTIADNELALAIVPTKLSPADTDLNRPNAQVSLSQNGVPFYSIENQVLVREAGSGTHIDVERVGPHRLRTYGEVGADAQPDMEQISIDEPALYAAIAFRQKLTSAGISVTGTAVAFHSKAFTTHDNFEPRPTGCERQSHDLGAGCSASCYFHSAAHVLASLTSPTLAQDVTYTLKVSQNLHAELLARRFAQHNECADGSSETASRLIREYLHQYAAIDPNDIFLYDGSGLSGHDLVTPRAAARLLAYATKQPWFAQWKAALPVGGEDGSLASRFAEAPLKDHVFAKTGTLGESRALSGYLDAKSGKQVIFSILVDDHAPSGSNDREVMDKIVAAIAANN